MRWLRGAWLGGLGGKVEMWSGGWIEGFLGEMRVGEAGF